MINELFTAVDHKDVDRFLSYLSSDCIFRFGNLPAVKGVEAIREFVTGFFDSIDSLSHQIEDRWDTSDGLICHGRVSYTRKDGSILAVPFANIFKLDASGIAEYLVFADTSQLYQ